MSEQSSFCAYCGKENTDRSKRAMAEHILDCEVRPERGLILKIYLMKEMGDNVLNTLHEIVKLMAELEGPRSKSWEIYRIAKEGWEIAKNTSAKDLAEAARSGIQEATDAVNDREA